MPGRDRRQDGDSRRREPVAACAEVLTGRDELERVQKLLLARYKVSYRVVMLFYRSGRRLRVSTGPSGGVHRRAWTSFGPAGKHAGPIRAWHDR